MIGNETNSWIIVFGLAAVNCVILGATNCTIGIFLPSIIDAFHAESREASLSATLFLLAMTITSPAVGWLVDALGGRIVMIGGTLVAALGYFCAAQSRAIWMFNYALLVGGAGVGFSTFVPSAFVISKCSIARQGLAFGILLGGASGGAAIFPPLANYMIELFGWRTTLEIISVLLIGVPVPIIFWLVQGKSLSSSQPASAEMDGQAATQVGSLKLALLTPGYWLLAAMQTLASFSYMGMYYYIAPYLIGAGYSANTASLFVGGIGVSSLAGYLIFGTLADHAGARWALIIGLAICSLSTTLLIEPQKHFSGFAAPILFVIFWGATFNLCNQLTPLLQVELVGSSHFGFLLGIITLIAGLAAALGPLLTGVVFDATKSYVMAFKICSYLMGCALIPIIMLKRPVPIYRNQ